MVRKYNPLTLLVTAEKLIEVIEVLTNEIHYQIRLW